MNHHSTAGTDRQDQRQSHAGQEASLGDAATAQLCREIIESQEAEIREMKVMLAK